MNILNLKNFFLYGAVAAFVFTIVAGLAYINKLEKDNEVLKSDNLKLTYGLSVQTNTINRLKQVNKEWETQYRITIETLNKTNKDIEKITNEINKQKDLKSLKGKQENESDSSWENTINNEFNNVIRLLNQATTGNTNSGSGSENP